MKGYRWLILIAAVPITGCGVLVFSKESGHASLEQADDAALTHVDKSTNVSGLNP